MTIMIIVYKMVVLPWPVAPAQCCFLFVFCLLYDNIICGQFIFFYLGGQSTSKSPLVSCKASLAALRLYGYFCDFCFVFVSEKINMMMMILCNYIQNMKHRSASIFVRV